MSNKSHAVPSNNNSSPEGPQELPPYKMSLEQRREHLQGMSGQFLGFQAAVADSTARPPEAVLRKRVRPTEELSRAPKRVCQKEDFEGIMEGYQQRQQEDPRPQFELREQNPQAEVAQQDFVLGAENDQMDNHHELGQDQSHPYPEVGVPRLPTADVFQPVVGVATESCKMPRRREQHAAASDGIVVVNPSEYEADENTVWIDSDEEDPEELVLKQNFFLSYSDHNYDCCDSSMRVMWPQEGVFPIIDGLSEEGNVIAQYMPEGYEYLARKVEEDDELPPTPTVREEKLASHRMNLPAKIISRVPKRVLQKRDVGGNMVLDQQYEQRDSQAQYEIREQNLQTEEAQQDFALRANEDQMGNHHEMDQGQHPYPEVEEPRFPAADVFQPVVDAQYELREQNLQAGEALGADKDQMDNNHEMDQDQHYQDPEVDEPLLSQCYGVPTTEQYSRRGNRVENGTISPTLRVPQRGNLPYGLPTSASRKNREASSQLMEIPVVDSTSVPSGAQEDPRMSSIKPPVQIIVNELYSCRCEKKCLFQVDGDNLLKSRSPSHFMRLCRLKEVYPQIDVEDLLVLSQKQLPPQLDYLTEICWKSLCRCPTFSLWVKELNGWEAQFEERYKKSYGSIFGQESSDYWKVFKQLHGTK